MRGRSGGGKLVYSTQEGRLCPGCERPAAACECSVDTPPSLSHGIVRVSRETKGRKGKGVTLVRGLAGDRSALQTIAKQLKTLCGSGGTVKNGVIEIQGEHRDTITAALIARGIPAKRSGG